MWVAVLLLVDGGRLLVRNSLLNLLNVALLQQPQLLCCAALYYKNFLKKAAATLKPVQQRMWRRAGKVRGRSEDEKRRQDWEVGRQCNVYACVF